MKKFFAVLGGIFLVLVLGVAVFIGYAAYQGKELDEKSKAYVLANVPPIISAWSKDELLKRSSPQLLDVIKQNPAQLDLLFQKLSKLGAFRRFDDVKGDSNVSYSNLNGKVTTAYYTGTAKFENGEARIAVRLVLSGGQWQFLLLNVDSPIFLQ